MNLFTEPPRRTVTWCGLSGLALLALSANILVNARPGHRARTSRSTNTNTKSFTGHYAREDGSDLDVLVLPGHKMEFGIAAVGPYSKSDPNPAPSTGDLYGTVALVGSHAVYRTSYGDGVCRVTFQFLGSKAVLSQGDSDCDFGAGVDVTGVYQKKNSRVPKPEMFEPDN